MSSQNLNAGLSGRLEQHQILSQSLRRSLEVLAMPSVELSALISAELAANPLLEEVPPEPLPELPAAEASPENDYDENDYDANSTLSDHWADDLPLPTGSGEQEFDYISQIPVPPPQLRVMLLQDIYALELSEEYRRIAVEIVSALNDDGYLAVPLADLAMSCDAPMEDMEKILLLVQKIAPAGVAARDLGECLKLQLIRQGKLFPEMEKLLNDGLADLERNRLADLERNLGITAEKLESMLKILRGLNPFPGREYSTVSPGELIVPDMAFLPGENGGYKVVLRKDPATRVQIVPIYEKLLDDRSLSAEDRKFFNEKLLRAKELIQSLASRGSTLQRLGEFIVKKQSDFLDHGVEKLHNMTMKEAAEALELSESTISRAVSGKYAETHRGVLPLKYFFPTGGTAEFSNQAVLQKIKGIIEKENPSMPFSDDDIAGILKKSGISIARRTVAKYRDMLHIPSSSHRKR